MTAVPITIAPDPFPRRPAASPPGAWCRQQTALDDGVSIHLSRPQGRSATVLLVRRDQDGSGVRVEVRLGEWAPQADARPALEQVLAPSQR